MRKHNEILQKVGKEFTKEIKEIITLRRPGVDRNFPREISFEKVTNGIVKDPEWESIKKRLLKEPRKEDLQ